MWWFGNWEYELVLRVGGKRVKKRLELEVMYGDADAYETFRHTTENEMRLDFLHIF